MRRVAMQGGLLENPAPRMCRECGKAMPAVAGRRPRFCSPQCATSFYATANPAEGQAPVATLVAGLQGTERHAEEATGARHADKARHHLMQRRSWDARHTPGEGLMQTGPRAPAVTQAGLRQWYASELQTHMPALSNREIVRATGLSRRYAIMIRQGYIPHPRHFAALARLANVPLSPDCPLLATAGEAAVDSECLASSRAIEHDHG
jgi:hypothetical protein